MFRFLFVTLVLQCLSCQVSKESPKDILFIYTDDQAKYSDAYLDIVMPNVQAWVKDRSVTYSNYICSSPYCAPSRATVITGQFPHNTGHYNNTTSYKDFYTKFGNETLGAWMQSAGYHTIFVGKYFNPNFPFSYDKNHIPKGWDDFIGMRGGLYKETPYTMLVNSKGINNRVPKRMRRSEYEVLSILNYLEKYTENNLKKPLFIYYAPFEPHTPQIGEARYTMYDKSAVAEINNQSIANVNTVLNLEESEEVNRLFKKNLLLDRFRSLFSLDIELGKLFSYLDDHKLYDDMFVFYTSDNGFILGEHSRMGKEMPFSNSVNVPFFAKHPNSALGNSQNDKLIGTIDLAATFMDIAGLDHNYVTDGVSILDSDKRDFVYAEMINMEKGSWYMIRSEHESLIEYEAGKYKYYNLQTDPDQLKDMYDTDMHYELVTILQKKKACKGNCL